ncbi:zinc finger protein 37 [Sardina pilchardus]|uniref:zinc finger protein 37 n=1 Tax=Sardina pilchardus TaxID=27697 RepID=UPI002E14917F
MIHECAVDGCPNKSDTIIHYTLPEEPTRRQKWIEFLQRSRKIDPSCVNTRICGSHFTEDSFTKLNLGFTTRLILNVNAVPCIYPDALTTQPKQIKANETHSTDSANEVESGIIVSDAISLACVKEEPLQEELSCDAVRAIKVEPLEDLAYGDSSSHQHTDEEMFEHDGTILKIEVCEDPISIDDGKPFHCTHCGEGFLNKGALKHHEIRHALSPPSSGSHLCKHCGKVFAHKAFLKAHLKIHASMESQMSFACSKCTRRFRNQSSLNKHMHNHLTRLKYPCPVCGVDFELKGSLHLHIKMHPGERFSCKFCDQRFLKFDTYLRHVDRHTVVTPYYCEICKIYQLTERGFLLHQKRHAHKDFVKAMVENGKLSKKGTIPSSYLDSLPQHHGAEGKMVGNSLLLDTKWPLQSSDNTETEPLVQSSECPSPARPCETEMKI